MDLADQLGSGHAEVVSDAPVSLRRGGEIVAENNCAKGKMKLRKRVLIPGLASLAIGAIIGYNAWTSQNLDRLGMYDSAGACFLVLSSQNDSITSQITSGHGDVWRGTFPSEEVANAFAKRRCYDFGARVYNDQTVGLLRSAMNTYNNFNPAIFRLNSFLSLLKGFFVDSFGRGGIMEGYKSQVISDNSERERTLREAIRFMKTD